MRRLPGKGVSFIAEVRRYLPVAAGLSLFLASTISAQPFDILSGPICEFSERYEQETTVALRTDILHMLHGPGLQEDCSDCARDLWFRQSDLYFVVFDASGEANFDPVIMAAASLRTVLEDYTDHELIIGPFNTIDFVSGRMLTIGIVNQEEMHLALQNAEGPLGGAISSDIQRVVAGELPCIARPIEQGGQPLHFSAMINAEIANDPDQLDVYEYCLGASVLVSLGFASLPFSFSLDAENAWRNATPIELIAEQGVNHRLNIASQVLYSGLMEIGQPASRTREILDAIWDDSCG